MGYLILISGSGRNTGKTTLACEIIKKFSEKSEITAVKISDHKHELTELQEIVFSEQGLIIALENNYSSEKDSSRYLQAGAKYSYFIQLDDSKLESLRHWMNSNLKGVVICESSTLGEIMSPDKAFFVYSQNNEKRPSWLFPYLTTQLIAGVFVPPIEYSEMSIL